MVGIDVLLLLISQHISGFAKLAKETLIKQHGCDKVPGQTCLLSDQPKALLLEQGWVIQYLNIVSLYLNTWILDGY